MMVAVYMQCQIQRLIEQFGFLGGGIKIKLYATFSVRRALYLRNCRSSGHNFSCTCVKWYLLAFFFLISFFFLFFIFGLSGGVKGQKIVQMKNKNYLRRVISPEKYSFWSWVLVHLSKKKLGGWSKARAKGTIFLWHTVLMW